MKRLVLLSNLLGLRLAAFIATMLTFFYYLILVPAHQGKLFTALVPFTPVDFILFVTSVCFLATAGSIIYNYFTAETESDAYVENALTKGVLSLDTAMYLHGGLALSGIVIGFYLGYSSNNVKVGYLYVVAALLIYLVSVFLRKIPLAGNVVISFLVVFPLVLLMIFEVNFLNTISFESSRYVLDILLWQVKFYVGFTFLIVLSLSILNDLIGKSIHEEAGQKNLTTQLTEHPVKGLVGVILSGVAVILVYFSYTIYQANALAEALYLSFLVALPVLAAAVLVTFSSKQQRHFTASLLLQFSLVIGIFSIPIFYLLNQQPS